MEEEKLKEISLFFFFLKLKDIKFFRTTGQSDLAMEQDQYHIEIQMLQKKDLMQMNVLFLCKLEWQCNKYKASSLCLTHYEKP